MAWNRMDEATLEGVQAFIDSARRAGDLAEIADIAAVNRSAIQRAVSKPRAARLK